MITLKMIEQTKAAKYAAADVHCAAVDAYRAAVKAGDAETIHAARAVYCITGDAYCAAVDAHRAACIDAAHPAIVAAEKALEKLSAIARVRRPTAKETNEARKAYAAAAKAQKASA